MSDALTLTHTHAHTYILLEYMYDVCIYMVMQEALRQPIRIN
jgi:hypothetical protein